MLCIREAGVKLGSARGLLFRLALRRHILVSLSLIQFFFFLECVYVVRGRA